MSFTLAFDDNTSIFSSQGGDGQSDYPLLVQEGRVLVECREFAIGLGYLSRTIPQRDQGMAWEHRGLVLSALRSSSTAPCA